MSQQLHARANSHSIPQYHGKHHDSFLVWFLKKIPTWIGGFLKSLMGIFAILGALFVGILVFLNGFKEDDLVKEVGGVLWFILLPILVALICAQLTLLPFLIVVALVLASIVAPSKYVFMAVGASVFFSFFVVFLV